MEPDHMPRPFDRPHPDDHEPVRISVHGGEFQEVDLIRALDQCVAAFIPNMPAAGICRAADWLARKYGSAQ